MHVPLRRIAQLAAIDHVTSAAESVDDGEASRRAGPERAEDEVMTTELRERLRMPCAISPNGSAPCSSCGSG